MIPAYIDMIKDHIKNGTEPPPWFLRLLLMPAGDKQEMNSSKGLSRVAVVAVPVAARTFQTLALATLPYDIYAVSACETRTFIHDPINNRSFAARPRNLGVEFLGVMSSTSTTAPENAYLPGCCGHCTTGPSTPVNARTMATFTNPAVPFTQSPLAFLDTQIVPQPSAHQAGAAKPVCLETNGPAKIYIICFWENRLRTLWNLWRFFGGVFTPIRLTVAQRRS